MADVTDGAPPTGGSPFDVPGDLKKAYDHFGAPEMFAVATASALPSADNWPGRQCMVQDTSDLYVWTGSAWLQTVSRVAQVVLTPINSFTVASDPPTVLGQNGVAYFDGGVARSSAPSAGVIAFVIPAGLRPLTQQRAMLRGASEYLIEPNGNFTLTSTSGLTGAGWRLGHITYRYA